MIDKPNLKHKKWHWPAGALVMVLLLTCLIKSYGQDAIRLTDSVDEKWIGKNIYYLKDAENQVSLPQILSGIHDQRFVRSQQESPNFGNVQLTIWNKFTIVNNSTQSWHLLVDNYSIDSLNFYYPVAAGEYQKIMSGRSVPLSKRQYKTPIYAFDITIPYGDSAVFYLKVSSHFMQYPLILMTKEKFIASYHRKDMLAGFYYGFLLFIVLYNLFMYFSSKDRIYIYYILYVIFVGLMVAELKGFIQEILGDSLHFMWQYAPAVIALSACVTIIFTQQILETRKHTVFLHRVFNYLFLPLFSIIILLNMLGQNLYASILNQVVGMVLLFVMLLTAIIVYRQGIKFARFYIAACWSYFLGVIIYVLKAFTILPNNTFTDNAIEIGSSLQMIMFAFTLADKVRAYRRDRVQAQMELVQSLQENERLVKEQNKILELKVIERTNELQHTLSALEVSQQELELTNKAITYEKERSDKLLLNILPFETALELKKKGTATAKLFEQVTVMFTDFKDFTGITEKMEPSELVLELDTCFKAFDDITDKYSVEKIKTIGDSYMAASNLPVPYSGSVVNMINAALDILAFMHRYNQLRIAKSQRPLEIRIGIHTGPIVAGIVGARKFAYDIWGDTVNTASRIESCSAAGRVNISGATYQLIKDAFHCTYRGKIAAKSKGEIDMYFVESEIQTGVATEMHQVLDYEQS